MPLSLMQSKKNTVSIKPVNTEKAEIIISDIKKKLLNENYRFLILDLSEFGLFDSIRIGTIVSTYHFIQFMSGQITVVVQDNTAKRMIETLKLRNTTVIIGKQSTAISNIA